MRAGQRRQADLVDAHAGLTASLQLARQRMTGVHLVVAVGAHQHQVAQLRMGQQVFQQVEGRRIQPLQVVEEQRRRVIGTGEHSDEAAEHQQEAALRLLWFQLGHRRLIADDQPQLGNQVGDQPGIGLQRLQQCTAPALQYFAALAQ
ncbi:hypothetical protein D9M71_294210 [compost metagenome]